MKIVSSDVDEQHSDSIIFILITVSSFEKISITSILNRNYSYALRLRLY